MRCRKLVRAIATVVLFSAACGSTADPVVTGLIDRTKPDGGRVTEYFGLNRTSAGIDASWLVETDMTWDHYAQWIRGRLSPGFESVGGGPNSLTFRKALDADSYTIVFESMPGQNPMRVRVTVQGRPL